MNYLRPDEKTALYEQEEAEKGKRFLQKGVNTAIGVGTALSGSGALLAGGKGLSKILPLLNKYIPTDLAIKGISKLNPKIGDFIKKGMEQGLNVQDGLDFVKENITKEQKAKEPFDVISGYSPELSRFIKDQVQNGRSPKEAAAIAKTGTPHSKAVKDIEKKTKENFVDYIERLFGGSKENERISALNQFNQKKQGVADQEAERFQNYYGDQQQQPQQVGPGQQALMSVLQKVNQRLGQ